MSCKTNASRSAGARVSSTTSSASPPESASSAGCSGSKPSAELTIGSGTWVAIGSSRRDLRARSMFSETRAMIVVSQARRFSTAWLSERLRRSHVSWTASSPSASEPSIRYATARRCERCCSNRSASHSRSSISSHSFALACL